MAEHTEQQQPEEMSEEIKQQWASFDEGARRWTKINREETEKARIADEWANLGAKGSKEYRDFIKKTCGFDPGA